MAKVTFFGACGAVTGSATLLSWGSKHILVDCGLWQGPEELKELNWRTFPVPPSEISAVVLTHAHLDHTGLLPRITSRGFDGPVYCSRPSRGLISLVLEDAGHLQEEQARYARKKGYSRHEDPQPLYTAKDSRNALRLLEPRQFDQWHPVLDGIKVRFRRAGHLLGAASVEISGKGSDGKHRSWCFSGDLGRYDVPILVDPEPPLDPPHTLVLESTYGDRIHDQKEAAASFGEVIRRTFDRGGTVLIPSFALGRSQEVLYHLATLVEEGLLDPDDVFLDSPMSIKATEIYERATSEHDEEFLELVQNQLDPLGPDRFHRCQTVDDSKALNERRRPAVIVASSGMATGGRIVHHLLHRLGDKKNTVVFVGYQAAGTRGRALVEGADMVAIHGLEVPVRATVHYFHMLSAHADSKELLRWCQELPEVPRRIFVNHGEDPSRKALAASLVEHGFPRPHLPLSNETVPW